MIGFELAALPTTTDAVRSALLNFAIVGGGPTGIEFAAELHDVISEDLIKHYPELAKFYKITVYDVADKVLSMFDEKLSKYASQAFKREKIEIKTSHHVQELRKGAPEVMRKSGEVKDEGSIYTIKLKEEGEVGIGKSGATNQIGSEILTLNFRDVHLVYGPADESVRPESALGLVQITYGKRQIA